MMNHHMQLTSVVGVVSVGDVGEATEANLSVRYFRTNSASTKSETKNRCSQ